MSYFDWINPTGYQDLFSAGSQATQKQPAASKQFAFSDYKLPSQPSSTWTDPATGLTMDRVASSRYYDVESEKTKTGYNWHGTRIDIYKATVNANSIYASTPYSNPILPGYDNPYSTAPYMLPTSQETYTSKMVYDKDLGKYVQSDTLVGREQMSYADRVRLGAPDNLTSNDLARALERKNYYSKSGGTK
jgi:hypothetical protein